MRLSLKLLLLMELVLIGAVVALVLPLRDGMRRQVIEDIQRELTAIAATAALQLDADLLAQIDGPEDTDSPAFTQLREQLTAIRTANDLTQDEIYTFYCDAAGVVRFGVMTDPEPFVGDTYSRPGLADAFVAKRPIVTDLYEDEHGRWVSAVAPIRTGAGRVVGLLEVNHEATTYFERFHNLTWLVLALGVGVLGVTSLVGWRVLRRTVIEPVERIHDGIRALGARDFSHRIELATRDEFQQLGETFNSIVGQLNAARSIQVEFFPKSFPHHPAFRFTGVSQPCDATGGDYYDIFALPSGEIAVVVADVSGHGLAASLLMAACRSVLRALAASGLRPGELVDRLDVLLEEDLAYRRFITLLYGVLSPTGEFTYANAGHGPALLVRSEGVTSLQTHRTPIGVRVPGDVPTEATVHLAPGDRLFLASDGVSEAANAAGELFGEARLRAIVGRPDLRPADVLATLDAAVTAHRGSVPLEDDVTMVCIDRVAPTSAGSAYGVDGALQVRIHVEETVELCRT